MKKLEILSLFTERNKILITINKIKYH